MTDQGNPVDLDDMADAEMLERIERNKVRIQSLLAQVANLRVDSANVRFEMKRRERELYS